MVGTKQLTVKMAFPCTVRKVHTHSYKDNTSSSRSFVTASLYTVPKVIDFPRYNMKCSGENEILRGICPVVSGFPLHFLIYRGNVDYFLDSV